MQQSATSVLPILLTKVYCFTPSVVEWQRETINYQKFLFRSYKEETLEYLTDIVKILIVGLSESS